MCTQTAQTKKRIIGAKPTAPLASPSVLATLVGRGNHLHFYFYFLGHDSLTPPGLSRWEGRCAFGRVERGGTHLLRLGGRLSCALCGCSHVLSTHAQKLRSVRAWEKKNGKKNVTPLSSRSHLVRRSGDKKRCTAHTCSAQRRRSTARGCLRHSLRARQTPKARRLTTASSSAPITHSQGVLRWSVCGSTLSPSRVQVLPHSHDRMKKKVCDARRASFLHVSQSIIGKCFPVFAHFLEVLLFRTSSRVEIHTV